MHSDASSGCGKLDAYFDGELAPSEQATFNAHLAACAACREAIEQQRWVDELLRSDDAAQQEAAPPGVQKLRPSRRRSLTLAAAAAVAIVAALPWAARVVRAPEPHHAAPTIAHSKQRVLDPPALSTSVHKANDDRTPVATFVSSGSTIALPDKNRDPDVTIIRVYPVLYSRGGYRPIQRTIDVPKGTGDEL